jgi:hypothetical protein
LLHHNFGREQLAALFLFSLTGVRLKMDASNEGIKASPSKNK